MLDAEVSGGEVIGLSAAVVSPEDRGPVRRSGRRGHGHRPASAFVDRDHDEDFVAAEACPGLPGDGRPPCARDRLREPALRDERRHDPAAGHDDEWISRTPDDALNEQVPGTSPIRGPPRRSSPSPRMAPARDPRWSRQVQRAQLLRAGDGHREGDRRAAGHDAAPRLARASRVGADLDADRRAAAAAADRRRRPHRSHGRRPGQRLPAVACLASTGIGGAGMAADAPSLAR